MFNINKNEREETMTQTNVIDVKTIKLVYDYTKEENINWSNMMRSDYIMYLYTKSEELSVNAEDYAEHYTKEQVDALKKEADRLGDLAVKKEKEETPEQFDKIALRKC